MRAPGVFAATAAITLVAAGNAAAAFPQSPPNDPLFNADLLPNATDEQWDLASPALGFDRGISADRAWQLSTGRGVTIADVDVGVQLNHPDLAGRWAINRGETGRDPNGRNRASNGKDDDHDGFVDDWRGWDFYARDNDPTSDTANAHGTNVAGVLGAAANNGLDIAGTAPGARILPVRTSDNILHQGLRVGEGIVYATDRGARAISMSLGTDSFSPVLRRAVRYAHRHGVVMAVASGNEFHFHHHYPQVMDDVLAVGGINPDNANLVARDPRLSKAATNFTVHASYADYGPHLDVVAPTQVPTTEWGGGSRINWDGTSAATPHVAAVAALVISRARALGIRLSADEVIQIIRMTATDLNNSSQGYGPGWDLLSGWGRVNAFAAVSRVAPGRIPPVANIVSPDWYAQKRGRFSVRGIARGRSQLTWRLELGGGQQPGSWRTIAHGTSTRSSGATLAVVDARRLGRGPWTLRLRATDSHGNLGEDRELFYAVHDSSLKHGYPKYLGASGESSPTLADVNGDHVADIVLATSGGQVNVWSGRTGRELRGWPRSTGSAPGSRAIARRIGTVRAGILGTPAVGNIAGGKRPEVVATTLDGRVYAWDHRGRLLRGFPFHIRLRRPAAKGRLDAAIYASPALADLDRDHKLDIVFGAADQRIYALKGNGRLVKGWPVLARDNASGGDPEKILSSPAIGDLNGDGRPDVVEGTAEAYGSTPAMSGRVYAFSPKGKRLPGWPVSVPGIAVNSIPLAGQGVPMSPVLADVDGDRRDEVAVASFTGEPELYRGDGTRMSGAGGPSHFEFSGTGPGSHATAPSALALGAGAAFGRLTRGGPLDLFGGMIDSRLALAQSSPATKVPFEHLLGGWDAKSGSWLASFPAPMEGWQIPSAPAVADVDGDRKAEVIAGSSGDVLHAFRADGSEPRGWPKDTGGWLLASPAVGDVDGDGKLEVVAVTRDGYLWVWNTPAHAKAMRPWPSFRHDARNSGRYR